MYFYTFIYYIDIYLEFVFPLFLGWKTLPKEGPNSNQNKGFSLVFGPTLFHLEILALVSSLIESQRIPGHMVLLRHFKVKMQYKSFEDLGIAESSLMITCTFSGFGKAIVTCCWQYIPCEYPMWICLALFFLGFVVLSYLSQEYQASKYTTKLNHHKTTKHRFKPCSWAFAFQDVRHLRSFSYRGHVPDWNRDGLCEQWGW